MKYSRLKTLVPTAICVSTLIALTTFTGCTDEIYAESRKKAQEYFSQNQTFDIKKVDSMIDYWGGDSRYVKQSFNPNTYQYNKIYNHFKNKKGEPIVVHYSNSISIDQQVQFDYVFKYLNDVFEVVNPNYTFIAQSGTSSNCDIYIEFTDIDKVINTNQEVLACTKVNYDSFNNSQISSAEIYCDKNIDVSNSYKRLALVHEMMHVLYGSGDVNENLSQTFSIYNYGDVSYMSYVIDRSKNTELQESYVFMTPTDLSSLISLYGDNTKTENKLAYLELLNNTLTSCSEVFGPRQPYYEKGYNLPTQESIENTSTQSFSYSPNLTNSYYKEDGANSQL